MKTDQNVLEEKIIIQITDTHLMEHPESTFVQINPEQSFHAVIDDILATFPHIDAIIHTGDLAQVAQPATYQRYLNYMSQLNIPFYQVPGNHDNPAYFPFYKPDPELGVVHFGNWCICLMNTAVVGKIDGWIQQEQLLALATFLSNNQNKHVIMACHHHPLEMNSLWIDRHKLKNTDQLTEVLSSFDNVKLVICGHVHQDSLNVWRKIHFLSTPSTSVQFMPLSEDFALDDISPGYRSLHLKANGEFATHVHRISNYKQQINKQISGY